MPRSIDALAALVRKDLLSEYRSRAALTGAMVFSLLALVTFNFAFDVKGENVGDLAPGVLWMVFIFAGLLGVGRGFAVEIDRGTLDGMLLAPIDRSIIYGAKATTNVILMGIVQIVSLPIFLAMFDVQPRLAELTAVLVLGTVGFSVVGTLCAAIAASSSAREVLLPLLLLPLEAPVVIASVQATAAAIGEQGTDTLPWLQLLLGFDVVLVACAVLMFEYIVEV
jgi:heme exporter protein B